MKNAEVEGAKWEVDDIKALLEMDDAAVERAIVVIFERQTADEQAHAYCAHLNGRGFNKLDAEFGTSLAKGCLKYGHLTPKQLPYARKMMLKYVGQLTEAANEKLLKDMEAVLA